MAGDEPPLSAPEPPNECRRCGERFTYPAEGGVPACRFGALHLAGSGEEESLDGSG